MHRRSWVRAGHPGRGWSAAAVPSAVHSCARLPAGPPPCAQGLPPGRQHYKFIVDGGSWNIDLAAPTETDLWGNVNNVVEIPKPPADASRPAEATLPELVAACPPAQQLAMARLGAALLAIRARQPLQRKLSRHALAQTLY